MNILLWRQGKWWDFGLVEMEIYRLMNKLGIRDRLPTKKEMNENGCKSLCDGIKRYHGGMYSLAKKLNLRYTGLKPMGYWMKWDNVERRTRDIMQNMSISTLPRYKDLRRWGCYDLNWAWGHWGGRKEVARRMGISI